jgi:hypothetical protein
MAGVCIGPGLPNVVTNEITISLTRANKILAKLRTNDSKESPYADKEKFIVNVSLLTYDDQRLKNTARNLRIDFSNDILKHSLIEKWKNRLFETNIACGVNKVLSEIEALKYELKKINYALTFLKKSENIKVTEVESLITNVSSSEDKFTYGWSVKAFENDVFELRLKEINKRLSILDDKKDELNIKTKFTIELSEKELELLDL